MKKNLLKVIFLSLVILAFTSCSAVMAASGKRESNVSALQKGDNKAMVMAKIGHQPLRSAENGNKSIEIYEIEKGNEPSVGRAIAHGTLDLLTLGLWEVVGTPLEAVNGEKYYITVEYIDGFLNTFQMSDAAPAGL